MNAFPAKFNGKCQYCQGRITLGESIRPMVPSVFIHETCTYKAPPHIKEIVQSFDMLMLEQGYTQAGRMFESGQVNIFSFVHPDRNEVTFEVFVESDAAFDGGDLWVTVSSSRLNTIPRLVSALERELQTPANPDFEQYRQKLLERYS